MMRRVFGTARWTILGVGLLLAAACGSTPAPTASAPTLSAPTAQPAATATSAPAEPAAATPTAEPAAIATAADPVPSAGPVTFQIVPDESQAAFTLDEELRGQPKTVIGATNQVSGALTLNPQDLSQTQVGAIQIAAGSLATDSGLRDRAIQNFILNTGQYPTITFQPQTVTGLSGAGQPGQTLTFQIAGDLTIRNVTQPVTFEVTATGDSATQLSGTATATIQRADYNLLIPSVPSVANVSEAVTLTLTFVARAGN